MKKKTKLLSVVLALVLAISAFTVMSVAVNAAETSESVEDDTPYLVSFELNNVEEFLEGFPTEGVELRNPSFTLYFSDGSTEEARFSEPDQTLYSVDCSHGYEYYEDFGYYGTSNDDGYIDSVTFYIGDVCTSAISVPVPEEVSVDHIELVNLPDKTEYIQGESFGVSLDGLEFDVYYTDSQEPMHIKYGDIYDGLYFDTSYFSSDGEEEDHFFDDLPLGEYTVKVYCSYDYESDGWDSIEICEYKINIIENPVSSIEIIKAPDKIFTDVCHTNANWDEYIKNGICCNMKGAQMQINYNDGTFDVYTFNENASDGVIPRFEYKGVSILVKDYLTALGEYEAEVEYAGKTTVFEVNHTGANSSAIVKVELTKLPDKVFTEPLFTDYFIPPKQGESLDLDEANKSIALNMKGAELTYYYANGESGVYVFDDYLYYGFSVSDRLLAVYTTELDEPYSQIAVTDLGNYKAKISFDPVGGSVDLEYEFSVKTNNETDSTITGNPANGNLASSDTAKSSTSDTATSDSVKNGNADNGAIATGSVMYSVVAIIVLVSACGVLAFFNRKRYLSK